MSHHETEQPIDAPPSGADTVDRQKRRLTRAALAAPLVTASLAARATGTGGGGCMSISGFMSGNQSPGHQYSCNGYGCTPGFWKNNPEAWKNTPYKPGSCKSWKKGKCDCFIAEGTTLSEILPAGCTPATWSTYVSRPIMLILLNQYGDIGGKTYAQLCHYIAAILNASASEASYGASVSEVQQGLCKAVGQGSVGIYKDILARLNERGCMFNAHGDCNDKFVMVNYVCVPTCPSGHTWDPVTMTCKPN